MRRFSGYEARRWLGIGSHPLGISAHGRFTELASWPKCASCSASQKTNVKCTRNAREQSIGSNTRPPPGSASTLGSGAVKYGRLTAVKCSPRATLFTSKPTARVTERQSAASSAYTFSPSSNNGLSKNAETIFDLPLLDPAISAWLGASLWPS